MHTIQSTYSYRSSVSVYTPMNCFSAIGTKTKLAKTFLPAFKKAENVLQCNFPLYSQNNNINQHQHADETAVILTKNIQLKKIQFDYS
jgi:hypothetical protein